MANKKKGETKVKAEGLEQTRAEWPPINSPWDKPGVADFVEGYWADPNEMALRQAVANWLGDGHGGRLLDVGCGSARVAPLLRGWDYNGADGSEKLLAFAAKRVKPAKLTVADITRPLPFKDDYVDAILCMNVLRHLDSYEAVVAEMARVAISIVYIVDMFVESPQHHQYGESEVAGQRFANNTWALVRFLADAKRVTGWKASTHLLPGLPWQVIGVKLEPA